MCTGRNSVPCCHFSSVMCCMHVVCWVSACSLDGNTFCILFTTFPWEGSRAVQLWSCRRLSSRSTRRKRRERVKKPIVRSLRRSISSRFKQTEDHPAPPPKKKLILYQDFFLPGSYALWSDHIGGNGRTRTRWERGEVEEQTRNGLQVIHAVKTMTVLIWYQ